MTTNPTGYERAATEGYAEAQAILAAANDDECGLAAILLKLTPDEVRRLQDAADRLDRWCGAHLVSRGGAQPLGSTSAWSPTSGHSGR